MDSQVAFITFEHMKKWMYILPLVFGIACTDHVEETQEEQQKEVVQRTTKTKPRTSTGNLDSLNSYISANSNDAAAYARRANAYLKKRNLQFALADVNEALRLDSTLAEAHLALGSLYYTQNKTREARNAWTKCVSLEKEHVECRMRLAELYIAVKNYDKALVLLNEVTEIDKQNATAYLMKGVIARDFKADTSLALNYFQRAIDLDQEYMDALDLMAVSLTNQGDTLAKYYYDRMLSLDPNRSDTYYKMGVFYMKIREYNRALEAYTKAVQLNPADAQSHYNMGFIHIEVGEYKKALEFFNQAIQLQERNYQAYYARGYCYEMLGNADAAKADYRKSLDILSIYQPAAQGLSRIKQMDAQIEADKRRRGEGG